MNKINNYIIRYSIGGDELAAYSAAFYELQSDAMEYALAVKEDQGFPEAMEVINRLQFRNGR